MVQSSKTDHIDQNGAKFCNSNLPYLMLMKLPGQTNSLLRGHLKSSHIADKRKNFHMGGRGFGPDSLCDGQ